MIPSRMLQVSTVPNTYRAEDFHRLTNRVALSSPTPNFFSAGEFVAEQTNNREVFPSADKRPVASVNSPPCGPQSLLCSRIRKGSCSSVKEEGSGKLMYCLRLHHIFTCKGWMLINQHEIRYSSILSGVGQQSHFST